MTNYRDPGFLEDHIKHTMAFYHPKAIDQKGGFYHFFKDNGEIYDKDTRHLVSSTRFVITYSNAWRRFKDPEYLKAVEHGVAFLRERHRNPATGGYAWQLKGGKVDDGTNHCYGLAFVLVAYSYAALSGVKGAKEWMSETWDLMEKRFWSPESGLYADEASADWSTLYPYRGQNANMHACEAMLAAYDATGEQRYLDRAYLIAKNIAVRQAALAKGIMWEHYHEDWSVDWEYNKNDKTNIFRPWGYQPGHMTEWAKLLLTLERHAARLKDTAWLAPRAAELFDLAMERAWDREHGGLVYGFGPDKEFCDPDKYFWVQAESIAAAALLALRTRDEKYWGWYDRIWDYSWTHLVDHQYGAWYRILTRDNKKYSDEKSPAGKVDYHTMGACYEVLNALGK
ncbi:MAG: AGE family epimerase/isomerase [Elusimicrobiota bacterium]